MNALAVLTLFGAGVASFASPCVLPLMPAWAGVALGSAPESSSQTLRSALPFAAGLVTTFAALGAFAGSVGNFAQDAGTWLPRVGGVLLVGFGLFLLGMTPPVAMQEFRLITNIPSVDRVGSPIRGFVAGVAVGASWTPCVGPLLGAALTVAASSGGATDGAVLLCSYALGIALPFLIAALVMDSWPQIGQRLARHGVALRRASGVILVIVGLSTAFGLSSRLVSPFARLMNT